MNPNTAWLVVFIVFAGCGKGKGDEAPQNSSSARPADAATTLFCDDHGAALVLAPSVNRSRVLGSIKAPARAIDDEKWFATDCKFEISNVYGHDPQEDCRPKSSAPNLPVGLTMEIARVGSSDTFVMKLGRTIKAQLHPMRFVAPGQLVATPPFDFLVGDDQDHRKYFVYFRDSLGPTIGIHQSNLEKNYGVQMFYPDEANPGKYLCADDMPSHASDDVSDGMKVLDSPAIMAFPFMQGGVGGGTEPPHHY